MNVSALHQTKHLACVATDVQRLAIKLSAEWIQSRHDVGDGSITVVSGMRRFGLLSLCPNAGFVSLTICSQKSTPTRLSWNMLWSNMYSAASPRFTIHSAIAGGRIPKAMFCAYVAHVAWLSPQIPQMRLVMKWASRGSLPFMNML